MARPAARGIGGVVKQLREEAGMTQKELADRVNVSQQSIDALEAGRVARPKYIVELSEALSVKPKVLLEASVSGLKPRSKSKSVVAPEPGAHARDDGFIHRGQEFVSLPVYDIAASAGPGALLEDAQETPLYYEFRPLDWLSGLTRGGLAELALVWVRGDAMEPTLRHNDQILVDRAQRAPSNPGLFILRIGEEVVVKRLQWIMASQRVRVISDNERYETEEMSPSDLTILGRVVWLGREIG